LPFPERQQQRQNGYLISEAIQKLRKEQAIGKADLQELVTSLKKAITGVQRRTVRNIVLAWVLTLPVCIFLGTVLFAAALLVFFNLLC
jgi:phosphate/sulfate permease